MNINYFSLLLIENLNDVHSRIQRADLSRINFNFVTRKDIQALSLSVGSLGLKACFPKDPTIYVSTLPSSFMSLFKTELESHLEIEQLQFDYSGRIIDHDNYFLETLSRDYWKGDFSRTRVSLWVVLFPDLVDYRHSRLLGYRSLESVKVTLFSSSEKIREEFNYKDKDTSFYIEKDILTPSDHPTPFTIEVSGLYIDPENGPEMILIGSAEFTNPMEDLYYCNITSKDSTVMGTLTIRTENEIPLICCSVLSLHNILLDHMNEIHGDASEDDSHVCITASVENPATLSEREKKLRRIRHKSPLHTFSKEIKMDSTFLLPVTPGTSSEILFELHLVSKSTGNVSLLGSTTVMFDSMKNEVKGREVVCDNNNFTVAEIEYSVRWMLSEDITDVPQFNKIEDYRLNAENSIKVRLTRNDLDITLAAIKAAQMNNSRNRTNSDFDDTMFPIRGGDPNTNLISTLPKSRSSTTLYKAHRPRSFVAFAPVHEGKLHPICGDFASQIMSHRILGSYPSLHDVVSNTSPREGMRELWDIINSTLTKVLESKFGSLEALRTMEVVLDRKLCRRLQMDLVYELKSYSFAHEVWGLLLVPGLLDMPKIGNIRVSSGKRYYPMYGFVSTGTHLYVDSSAAITEIDEALQHIPMIGIRTAKDDKRYAGPKLLEFEVTGACEIFLCWDIKCHSSSLPRWVSRKGFVQTQFQIQTTESVHLVYMRRLNGASSVPLGGCACDLPDSNNYFVLIGKINNQGEANLFTVPNASNVGIRRRNGSVLKPVLPFGYRPIWQLRPSTPLAAENPLSVANDHLPHGMVTSNKNNAGEHDQVDLSGSTIAPLGLQVGESATAYIFTSIKLNVSEICCMFSQNSIKTHVLGLRIRDLIVDTELLRTRETGYLSEFARISTRQARCELSGNIIDPNMFTEEPFLQPYPITVDVSKITGTSIISVRAKEKCDQQKMQLKLTSKGLAILIDTIRNLQAGHRHEPSLTVNDDEHDRFTETSAKDILVLNKIGQVALLRLYFRNKGRVKVKQYVLEAGALKKINIECNYLQGHAETFVDMDFEIAEWSKVCNIRLNTSDGYSKLCSTRPEYTSTASTLGFLADNSDGDDSDGGGGEIKATVESLREDDESSTFTTPDVPISSSRNQMSVSPELASLQQNDEVQLTEEELWQLELGHSPGSTLASVPESAPELICRAASLPVPKSNPDPVQRAASLPIPFHSDDANPPNTLTADTNTSVPSNEKRGLGKGALRGGKLRNIGNEKSSRVYVSPLDRKAGMNSLSVSKSKVSSRPVIGGMMGKERSPLIHSDSTPINMTPTLGISPIPVRGWARGTIEGEVSLNPLITAKEVSCPFALAIDCKHTSREELLKDLGISRLQRSISTDADVEASIDFQFTPASASYSDTDDVDAETNTVMSVSERMTSIIDSTIDSSRERKAIVISFSSNVCVKNLTTASLSIVRGNAELSNPFESSESKLYPLPFSVLSYGHVEFMRGRGIPELVEEHISLSINQKALDPLIRSALRRSTEYERQSFIIQPEVHSNSIFGLSGSQSQSELLASTEHAESLSPDHEAAASAIEKSKEPIKWNLIALPSMSFINALPCALELAVQQPPHPSTYQRIRPPVVDGAMELFFLPEDFAVKTERTDRSSSKVDREWTPFQSGAEVGAALSAPTLFHGTIRGGEKFDLPTFYQDRAVYFRVRLPKSSIWSHPFTIPLSVHQNRKKYIKHKPEPVVWVKNWSSDFLGQQGVPPTFLMSRSWKAESNRAIEFFSPFWIINKSGLSFRYSTEHLDAIYQEESRKMINKSFESLVKTRSSTDLSDSANLRFVGSKSIPLVANLASRVKLLPYDLSTNVSNDQFYIYNVKMVGGTKNYRVSRGLRRDRPVYIDDDSSIIVSWPESIICLQSKTSQSCILRTATEDALSDLQAHVGFQLSHDAYVDLCIDSRCPIAPPWAIRLGFRKMQGQKIHTNHTPLSYNIYRKFYPSFELVILGGNCAESDKNLQGGMYFVVASKFPWAELEPSISNMIVRNQDSPFVYSRRYYHQLPWFSVGDRIYVDRDIRCFSLPAPLRSASSLLAIQTSCADSDVGNAAMLEFDLHLPSYIFMCVDASIPRRALPSWVLDTNEGFELTKMTLMAGHDGGMKFSIYQKKYVGQEEFHVSLPGLDTGFGSFYPNYFVIIAKEEDILRYALAFSTRENQLDKAGVIVREDDLVRYTSFRDSPLSARDNVLERTRGTPPYIAPSPSSANFSPLHVIEVPNDTEGIIEANSNLSNFWDSSTLGDLQFQPLALEPFGPQWSEPCSIEHGGKAEITASNCCFSVSTSRLPGLFSRTCAIMLLPRYIVSSKLNFALRIKPHIELVGRNGGTYDDSLREGANLLLSHHSSGVIFSFGDESHLGSTDVTETRRVLSISDATGGFDRAVFSKAIYCDEASTTDQFLWMKCTGPVDGQLLVLARTVTEGSTTVITLSDSSQKPPYRISNRASWTIKFRQVGTDEDWVTLPAHTWKSYALYDQSKPHKVEVSVDGLEIHTADPSEKPSFGLDDVHATSYISWSGRSLRLNGFFCGSTTVDGSTRELTVHELVNYSRVGINRSISLSDQNVSGLTDSKLMSAIDFKIEIQGLEVNLMGSDEIEILSTYIDGINLEYGGPSSSLFFSIYHIQIDDMRANAKSKFEVILCPRDSGHNSHLRENPDAIIECTDPAEDMTSKTHWLSVSCEWNPYSTQILHIRSVELLLQSLDVKIDGEMVLSLLNMLGDCLEKLDKERTSNSSGSFISAPKLHEIFMNAVKDILLFEITGMFQRAQGESSRVLMFIESFYHSRICLFSEVLFGRPDGDEAERFSANSLSAPMLSYMPEVLAPIAHTSPTIGFNEEKLVNFFGEVEKLIQPITKSFQQQALTQAYKIFGSMDVIGDPLALFEDIGTGFEKFLEETGNEIAHLDLKGEGVKAFVYSVVAGISSSVSKITGKIADIISSTTGTSRRYEVVTERENMNFASAQSQATDILFKSVMSGFSGMINEPGRGFSQEGSLGAVKGLFKGLVTLIATPVAGTLDAVSVVTGGVSSTFQQQDGKPIGRRRVPNVRTFHSFSGDTETM